LIAAFGVFVNSVQFLAAPNVAFLQALTVTSVVAGTEEESERLSMSINQILDDEAAAAATIAALLRAAVAEGANGQEGGGGGLTVEGLAESIATSGWGLTAMCFDAFRRAEWGWAAAAHAPCLGGRGGCFCRLAPQLSSRNAGTR
jgi:hypothetical protein